MNTHLLPVKYSVADSIRNIFTDLFREGSEKSKEERGERTKFLSIGYFMYYNTRVSEIDILASG